MLTQAALNHDTEGVMRYVWDSRFGQMLIEVVQGQVFVNGKRVEPVSATQAEPNGLAKF